jgi:hypothetical protein
MDLSDHYSLSDPKVTLLWMNYTIIVRMQIFTPALFSARVPFSRPNFPARKSPPAQESGCYTDYMQIYRHLHQKRRD